MFSYLRRTRCLEKIPISLRIAGLYLLVAVGWILTSDRWLTQYQTLKGLAFVLVSAALIGGIVHLYWRAREHSIAELRLAEARSKAVVEHAWDLVSIIGPDGTRRYHSPAAERILGYPAEDLIERGFLDFVCPDDWPRVRHTLEDLRHQPGASVTTDMRIHHADGSIRHLRTTATNLLQEPAVQGIVLNAHDVTEQKADELQIRRQLQQLAALHTIDKTILESHDLLTTLEVALEQIISQFDTDAASVLLYQESTGWLSYAAGCGFRSDAISQSRLGWGEGCAGQALADRQPLIIRDLGETDQPFTRTEFIHGEDFTAYIALPLIANDDPLGVLDLFSRSSLVPTEEWLNFAQTLAAQTAIAVQSALLFGNLQESKAELETAYERTLEGWALALELRDDESSGHSRRVVDLSLKLGRQVGMSEEELVHLRRGALLHDIGKIAVPDAVLLKPGPLNDDEWELMKRHPENAYQLLKLIPFLQSANDIPYCHHERWDGSGYPRGLRGREIPKAARVFAVADVVDALTSDRPYRNAWSREDALRHIQQEAGSLFDPAVCQALLTVLEKQSSPGGEASQPHPA